jgi:threonine-phosphate decarboxylase
LVKIKKSQISASSLKEMLILRGILIRDASNFEFLDSQFFRVAVKDHESNKKLIHELNNVLK